MSGERDVRSDTRQGLPRQGAVNGVSEKPGLVFRGMIAVPCVVCPRTGTGSTAQGEETLFRGGGGRTVFISADRGSRIGGEEGENVADLSDVLSRTPTLSGGSLFATSPPFNFSKTSVSKQMGLG